MKSVRLGADLENKLERAARALSTTQSEFIRDTLARRCAEVLGESLAERLQGVTGTVQSPGGRATKSGNAFRAALAAEAPGHDFNGCGSPDLRLSIAVRSIIKPAFRA